MKTRWIVIGALTLIQSALAGHKYHAGVSRLVDDHSYDVRKSADFFPVIICYVRQQTDNTCSIATLSTVLNALNHVRHDITASLYVTEKRVLERFQNESWAKALEAGEGLSLNTMGDVARQLCKEYKIDADIRVISVNMQVASQLDGARWDFHNALIENEKNANDFIILDYPQAYFVMDDDPSSNPENSGHFSLVGAYNAQEKRVLVVDVWREAEPYWVDENKLFDSLHTKDDCDPNHQGYRGYIVLKRAVATEL